MSQHRAPRAAAGRGSLRVQLLLALGLVACLGAVATSAFWTDQVTVTGTGFSAGTLDLEVNDDPDDAVALTTLSLSNMVPGNSAAGVLKVENTGTVPLAYDASTAATNPDAKNLAGALTVKVTAAASVTGTAPTATCGGTALAGTATSLSAPLVSAKRVLAPGASETLCVQVTLPAGAGNALQGSATVATFTFDATSELP